MQIPITAIVPKTLKNVSTPSLLGVGLGVGVGVGFGVGFGVGVGCTESRNGLPQFLQNLAESGFKIEQCLQYLLIYHLFLINNI